MIMRYACSVFAGTGVLRIKRISWRWPGGTVVNGGLATTLV